MEVEHFAELRNKQLFTRIVQSLWTLYDNGGISFGRSYIASLLECCRSFLDFTDLPGILEGDPKRVVKMRIAENESCERSVFNTIQLELPFEDLQVLSDNDLLFVLLEESHRWYQEEAEKSGFMYKTPAVYTELLRDFCLVAYPDINHERIKHVRFNKESLLTEGKNRRSWYSLSDDRHTDFRSLRLNPWDDYKSKRFWIKDEYESKH